jgi:hypothetical protein
MVVKTKARAVGEKVAKFPGEWVVVDADRGKVVAHNECLKDAVDATPAKTQKPNVYFATPSDQLHSITLAY